METNNLRNSVLGRIAVYLELIGWDGAVLVYGTELFGSIDGIVGIHHQAPTEQSLDRIVDRAVAEGFDTLVLYV